MAELVRLLSFLLHVIEASGSGTRADATDRPSAVASVVGIAKRQVQPCILPTFAILRSSRCSPSAIVIVNNQFTVASSRQPPRTTVTYLWERTRLCAGPRAQRASNSYAVLANR